MAFPLHCYFLEDPMHCHCKVILAQRHMAKSSPMPQGCMRKGVRTEHQYSTSIEALTGSPYRSVQSSGPTGTADGYADMSLGEVSGDDEWKGPRLVPKLADNFPSNSNSCSISRCRLDGSLLRSSVSVHSGPARSGRRAPARSPVSGHRLGLSGDHPSPLDCRNEITQVELALRSLCRSTPS